MKHRMNRRQFMGAAAAGAAFATLGPRALGAGNGTEDGVRTLLKWAVHKREVVDAFLDPDARVWASFDPDLGYVLRNSFVRDGVDGAYSLYRYAPEGHRALVNFADQPCRINTYGDSFTQGHQVSDGETWQEVLAAHFLEPIRNFGIGGHGVYQAYRRMLRTEPTAVGVDNIILNLWGDDHQRSINKWRYLTYADLWSDGGSALMFHGNPWCYARLDPETKELVEHDSDFRTPESLYQLCDEEFVLDYFGDDPVVHILAALRPGYKVDPEPIAEFGEVVGITGLDFSTWEQTRNSAWWVYNEYAWAVSKKLMEKTKQWADDNGKNMMILLSYPEPSVRELCAGKQRDELAYLDWHPRQLREHILSLGLPMIDSMEAHLEEFKQLKLSPEAYTARYYIGHYNPRGNHFFAFAIKNGLVDWLDPKPPAYRGDDDETVMRFDGYLPG